MRLLLFSLTSFLLWCLMIYTIHTYAGRANANDFDLTITTTTGGDLDILQDGENNDIDLDIQSMNNFEIDFSQVGDDNNIDIDVDGRTSSGSSITINQNGNNKTYTNTLWCGHTYCTMTVNQ